MTGAPGCLIRYYLYFYSLEVGMRTKKYGMGTVITEEPAIYNVAMKIERDVLQ